jgi:hypothetical protein
MIDFLLSIENLGFSAWMRESASLFGFPGFLWAHTLAMAIVSGGATIINLALLGLWPKAASIKPLERFYPIIWFGVALSAITGIGMFMKDASTYGRNWDLYVKLAFVFIGIGLLVVTRKRIFRDPQIDTGSVPAQAKLLASVSIVCWFLAIVSGRLIAYLQPIPGDF